MSETRSGKGGKLLCIPNFSEGRNSEKVAALAAAIQAAGATVMDASWDPDHHRSVIAFFADADIALQAAAAAAETAVNLIDLREHQGKHPRFGAIDVMPFVPLAGADMSTAVATALEAGKLIANRLSLPVFYYEKAARDPERRNLADVRAIGKRAAGALLVADDLPDDGPAALHETAGAVAIGARGPLVAYNVNIASDRPDAADRIARRIRSARITGAGMAGVKALGLQLPARKCQQVSTNVTRPDLCRPKEVFDYVKRQADIYDSSIICSELVGVAASMHLSSSDIADMAFVPIHPEQMLEHWGISYA